MEMICIKKTFLNILVLSFLLVVGCSTHEEANEYLVLIRLNGELYYVPKTVEESEYTLKEKIGTLTDTFWKEEIPSEDFTSNSFQNEDVYTVKEDKDIYVIPYATERHGNRYHVLEEYKGAE